jgi:cyclopropane-fatty-acyl-phospholipid synthase
LNTPDPEYTTGNEQKSPMETDMNSRTLPERTHGAANWRTQLARTAVRRTLAGLCHGLLTLREEDGSEETFGDSHVRADLHGIVEVRHPNLWLDLLANGALGAGEAYMKGYWSSPDLTAVVRVFCANMDTLNALDGPLARAAKPVLRTLHWLNRNTETQARRNTGRPPAGDRHRLGRSGRLCGPSLRLPGHHHHHLPGPARLRQGVDRAGGAGDRITLLLEDYRKLEGSYDKLVSIEMIEAVGHAFLPDYFRQLSRLLKPGGRC